MRLEIDTALDFLCKILNNRAPQEQVEVFRTQMDELLQVRFQAHWHPEQPIAGSGYRCIRWEPGMQDSVLLTAASKSGVDIKALLPSDFALWIDPNDVSARIGSYGSVFRLELGKGKTSPISSPQPSGSTSPARTTKGISITPAVGAGQNLMPVQQDGITVP